MKKKSSGLFNSFKAFVTNLLPFGLNSTVKGTRSNLQRLMTLQIAALPEELPAGEGYDTLKVRSLQETVRCLQDSLQERHVRLQGIVGSLTLDTHCGKRQCISGLGRVE